MYTTNSVTHFRLPHSLYSHPSSFLAPYRCRCLSILHARGCCYTIQADLRRTVAAYQTHRVPTTTTIFPPVPPLTCSKTRTALTAALCILPTLAAMSASFDNGSLAARAFVSVDAAPPLVKIAALLATGYPLCPHLNSDPWSRTRRLQHFLGTSMSSGLDKSTSMEGVIIVKNGAPTQDITLSLSPPSPGHSSVGPLP